MVVPVGLPGMDVSPVAPVLELPPGLTATATLSLGGSICETTNAQTPSERTQGGEHRCSLRMQAC